MPLIDYADPEDVPEDVRTVLEDHRQRNGRYSLLELVLARNPSVLELHNRYFTGLTYEGDLDRELKELVQVTVSVTNECEYCTSSHAEKLVESLGVSRERVEAIASDELDGFDGRSRAAVEFARQVATDPRRVTREHVDALHGEGFSDADIVELLVTVTEGIAANTICHTLNVFPEDYDDRLPEYYPDAG